MNCSRIHGVVTVTVLELPLCIIINVDVEKSSVSLVSNHNIERPTRRKS